MKFRKLGKLLIALSMAVILVVPAQASKIDDAKGDKNDLENKKSKAEQQLNSLSSEKQAIKDYVIKLDNKLAKLDVKITKLNKQLDETQTSLDKTEVELKGAKEDEKNQYFTMKKRIKFMYENGDTAYIEAIFSANSFGDLLNRAEYVSDISEYDHNMLLRLRETKDEIAATESSLKKQVSRYEALSEEMEEEQADVSKLVDDKNKQMEKYNKKIRKTKSLLKEYEAGLAEQEKLIARLEKEARQAQNNSSGGSSDNSSSDENIPDSGGQFIWPCPSSSNITSPYGYRIHPITGRKKLHSGVDIGAPTGASVLAAGSGTVILSEYSSSAGNWIIIDHGGGLSTVYMHNSSLVARRGDHVKRGELIARVGSTGMSTGSHLHFSVRVNGNYVNPMPYVK